MTRYLFLLLLFATACSSNIPGEVLPPPQMKLVVADLMQVDEFLTNYQYRDSSVDVVKRRSELYQRVFATYGVSRKKFYSSYDYYQKNPEVHAILFDSLHNYLERLKAEPVKPQPNNKMLLKSR